MYDDLVKRLRYCRNNAAVITDDELMAIADQATDAIEGLTAFAHYVAKKVFDEDWELDPASGELVCRKLNKIGVVEKEGEYWSYEPQKEDKP